MILSAQLLVEMQDLLGRHESEANPRSPFIASLQACGPSALLDEDRDTSPRLTDLLEEYAKIQQHAGTSQKTIDDKSAVVRLLAKAVGDLPINSIGLNEVKAFRDIALRLPPLAARRLNKLPELSLCDLIGDSEVTISITTFNNYVKNLSAYFHFAIQYGYVEVNPFKNMRIKQNVKASEFRGAFDKNDVDKILEFTADEVGFKFWLPRLGLYTGARLNELCQLYCDDVVEVRGLVCIHFREGREGQRLKSLHSDRVIPLHSSLVEMGAVSSSKRNAIEGCSGL
ncbi:hypothetical protein LG312_02735 [Halomonas sp.]